MLDLVMLDLTRERLRAGLGWFGFALACAPFAVALLWIAATRVGGGMAGEVPVGVFGGGPVLLGAVGSLPFFLLTPWLIARFPWLDQSVFGVFVLSALLSVPAVVVAHEVFSSLPIGAVCVVAFGSIAAPRLFAKSLRLGALSGKSGIC